MARWLVLVEIETSFEEEPSKEEAVRLALSKLQRCESPYNVLRHPEEA